MQSSYPYYSHHAHFQPQPYCGGGSTYGYYASEYEAQHGVPYFSQATYPVYDANAFDDATLPPLILQPFDYSAASVPAVQPQYVAPVYEPQLQYPTEPQATPIHAPTPVAAYPALLVTHVVDEPSSASPYTSPALPVLAMGPVSPAAVAPQDLHRMIRLSPAPEEPETQLSSTPVAAERDEPPRDTLEQYDAPQVLFPTPSDLLNDAEETAEAAPAAAPGGSSSHRSASHETAARRASRAKSKGKARASSVAEPAKLENLRKSYFRSVADKVGFESTDPDTITSHDKKRHYLECLEQYIVWLHEQLRIAGLTPESMSRIDTYTGLTSQSIRTLLVHMQNNTRKLNKQVVDDEERYFVAEHRLFPQHEHGPEVDMASSSSPLHAAAAERARRHSIANGMIPMCAESHIPALPVAPTVGMYSTARPS